MEGERTPTIICVILVTDYASIQLKVHLKFFIFQQSPYNEWRFKVLTHKETVSIVKGTLEKKLYQDR